MSDWSAQVPILLLCGIFEMREKAAFYKLICEPRIQRVMPQTPILLKIAAIP